MKHSFIYNSLLCLSILSSCMDNDFLPDEVRSRSMLTADETEAYHDKVRTQPYPKLSNDLYLNPSPLIVPQALKTKPFLQFALSQDSLFADENTLMSDTVSWCIFNPHTALATGRWYWRYRNVDTNGTADAWSETIPFDVKTDAPVFVTPSWNVFLQNLPVQHPRLYCFLDPGLEAARAKVTTHAEYKRMISRATSAMLGTDQYRNLLRPYKENNLSTVYYNVEYLYTAYHLTQDSQYADKLYDILSLLLEQPYTDADMFASNFGATYIAYVYLAPYDILYNRLTASERAEVERQIYRVAYFYYRSYCGMQENHIFDNHFWQQNLRIFFQIGLMLQDKPQYAGFAKQMLEYYYELWTARAPASGFNRDGAWINGMSYFNANVKTLFYMPKLLSYITGQDFLQHPWYRNAGQALLYSWIPNSKSSGFGDGSEKYDVPQRQRVAFADFLARELGDSYAGWYANTCRADVLNDIDLRIYRMVNTSAYGTQLPADAPKLKWYKDIGEVVMHSDLTDVNNNLTLCFRSSTFGSGSHTLADQNSFNLLYKGQAVYYHSGYFLNFSDAHNLMSYRHTRAHNTILVNGIGQPFSTKGYGTVLRADGGKHIGYCMGDASHAYNGITDDPMWIEAFAKAGITQTPENGFGSTPLTKYRRQMLMLYPDILLIYDDLQASVPVRWDWLLHSPTQYQIDNASLTFTSFLGNGAGKAVATVLTDAVCNATQTDEFVVPPTAKPNPAYPNQWHLTAKVENSPAVRFLTVVRVGASESTLPSVVRNGNQISCGAWNIHVNLNADEAEWLEVRNTENGAVYSYGFDNPLLGGQVYQRQSAGSSVLYDEVDGVMQVREEADMPPVSTRSVHDSRY